MSSGDLVSGLNLFFDGLGAQQTMPAWGRLDWGMSQTAVLRNYPQSRVDPDQADQLVLKPSGPQAQDYALTFGFDSPGRQLQSVKLEFGGSGGLADFAALSQAISARLGQPASQTETTTTWRRGQEQVSLTRSAQGGLVLSEVV